MKKKSLNRLSSGLAVDFKGLKYGDQLRKSAVKRVAGRFGAKE